MLYYNVRLPVSVEHKTLPFLDSSVLCWHFLQNLFSIRTKRREGVKNKEFGKGVAVPLNSAESPCGSRPQWSVFFCNESPVPLSAISPLCSWKAEVFHLSCCQFHILFQGSWEKKRGRVFYALIKDR